MISSCSHRSPSSSGDARHIGHTSLFKTDALTSPSDSRWTLPGPAAPRLGLRFASQGAGPSRRKPARRSSLARTRHAPGLKSKYSRSVPPLGVQMNAILLTPDGSLSKGFDGFHQQPQYNSEVPGGRRNSSIAGSRPEGKPMGYRN